MLYDISINFRYEVKVPKEDTKDSITEHLADFITKEYDAEADIVIEGDQEEEEEGE